VQSLSRRDEPSSTIKLARAQEHVDTLRTEIADFVDRKPYGLKTKPNADFTHYEFVADFHERPFGRWGAIAGDVVHNLRGALDNLIYEIAVHESGTDPPPNESILQLPIAKLDTDYKPWHIKSLSDVARGVIERYQPYNVPKGIEESAIYWINELDIRDKHRGLNVTSASVHRWDGRVEIVGAPTAITPTWLSSGAENPGTPCFTLSFSQPTPDVDVKPSGVTFQIFLERPRIGRDPDVVPVVPFLDGLVTSAHTIVGELRRMLISRR